MNIEQIIKYLEDLAPPGVAWSDDNVGLQIGDLRSKATNILLALDLNQTVIKEAKSKNCNFIFTHHPFLFRPLKKLEFSRNEKSKIVKNLIQSEISLFSAHTNFDFIKGGVSFELAEKIGLKNIDFLNNQENNLLKIAVFVPQENVDSVSSAMFDAGAGKIGEYSNCSFRTNGTGSFSGSENTNPHLGKAGKFEFVEEVKLEAVTDEWNKSKVLQAMINAHPYEEPAYDVFRLENKNVNFGSGAIGEFDETISKKEFFERIITGLKAKNFRFAKGKSSRIKKVAVCGGSGSFELNSALRKKADAFITADIKYHTFQDAENKIWLIDAGHYETEIHSLDVIKKYLEEKFREKNLKNKIYKFRGNANPVNYFN